MDKLDIAYSNQFLVNVRIQASELINIPSKGILDKIILEEIIYKNTTYDFNKRWKWFYKYRQALLQIKYPKANIEILYETIPVQSYEQQSHLIKNKIIARKRKITEFENRIQHLKDGYMDLFPIEQNPVYIELNNRKKYHEMKLENLNEELQKLES